MDTRDFCYWMAGFMELVQHGEGMSTTQVSTIKDHLKLVFDKITPDRFISALDDLEAALKSDTSRTVSFKDRSTEKTETTITCSAGDELPKSVDDSQYKDHCWTEEKTRAALEATSLDYTRLSEERKHMLALGFTFAAAAADVKDEDFNKFIAERARRHFAEELRTSASRFNPIRGAIKLC